MKKYIRLFFFALVCFFLTTHNVTAQQSMKKSTLLEPVYTWHIGIEGGYAYNSLYTNVGYRQFTAYEGGHAFSVGIPVRFKIFNWLSVQIEPQYIQKNYTLRRSGKHEPVYNTYMNGFVSFPLSAQFNWNLYKGLGLYLTVGGYLGVWAHSNVKGTSLTMTYDDFIPIDINSIKFISSSYDEAVAFDDRRDNRFDAGILAGLGIQYEFRQFTVFAEGRFNYGLTDLQKKYMAVMVPRMNDTWELRLGMLFNISSFIGGKK